MIRDLRRSHYRQLTLSLLGAAIVGAFFGYPWVFLAVSAIGYLIWISYQQHRLIAWLISGARKTPPEAVGLWGVIFDHLYRVQRDHRKQVGNYRESWICFCFNFVCGAFCMFQCLTFAWVFPPQFQC